MAGSQWEVLIGLVCAARRELEVAQLGAECYTTPEIARHLRIGERTVESHLSGVYTKLRIGSRAELIRMAVRLGVPAPTI
jgi:DNA-binding CsgD family transcriptional regulator